MMGLMPHAPIGITAAEVEDFQAKIFSTPFGRPRRETAVTCGQGGLKKNLE